MSTLERRPARVLRPDEHPELLEPARHMAEQYHFRDIPVVDVDAHHSEMESWPNIAKYIESPQLRLSAERYNSFDQVMPGNLGDRRLGRRFKRDYAEKYDRGDGLDPIIHQFRRSNEQLGIRYSILFPQQMLMLGAHPVAEMEVLLARAYAKWLTEEILPVEDGVKSLLYLPFNDPDASLRIVEEFGPKKGVVGFTVTSVRYAPLYNNHYMKVYRAIEEMGLPLAFHPIAHWEERPFHQLNKFLSVHALGFPFYNMVQLTNVVINGLPERFPGLKWIFMECGVSYLGFVMHRLDSEFLMRSSEAPLLKRRPSEYMKEFYYSTQPLEWTATMKDLEYYYELTNGENTWLYSSDYPHWDWDPPSRIWELPFLSEGAKKKILGQTALKLFRLGEK